MKITAIKFYGGSRHRAARLGMAELIFQLLQIIFETQIEIEERRNGNGAAVVREALDARFAQYEDWAKTASGGVDWVKKLRYKRHGHENRREGDPTRRSGSRAGERAVDSDRRTGRGIGVLRRCSPASRARLSWRGQLGYDAIHRRRYR